MKQASIFSAGSLPKSTKKAESRFWIEAARWRMLTMTSSRKLDSQGGLPRVTMQVFAQGAPRAMLREVLEELAAATPVKDLVIDNTVQPGEWHHKTAFWRRDDRGQPQGDDTLTIIRILSDGESTEEGIVEDGCGTRMTIRYVFDAAGIEDLSADPNNGRQGFSIRIGGVSRDPETYLLTYYVTTTEQLTVVTPEYISDANRFMTEYVTEYVGLRGTQAAPVTSDGVSVTVPNVGVITAGTNVKVRWEKDPQFCTWTLRIIRRVAKRDVEGQFVCDKDLFKETDSQETVGQLAKLGHAPAAANGLSVQHVSKPREDNLFDNTIQNNQEAEVADAVVSVSVGLRSIITETQDTNRAALPLPADSEVGKTVTNKKTPGNWFQRTVRHVRIRALALLRLVYSENLFKRETSETRVKAAPDPDPGFPGGGLTRGSSSQLNEENTWDVTTSEDREKPVSEAQKTVTVNQRSIVTEVQDIAILPLPYPADTEVGSSVTNKKTPGGIWERTSRLVRIRLLAILRQVFSETLYKKEDSVTTVKEIPDPDPGFAGLGLIKTTDSRLNEDNKWDVTNANDQEKLVERSQVRKSVGLGIVTTRVTDTQSTNIAEDLPVGAEGALLEIEKTPGGLRNRTTLTYALAPGAEGKVIRHSKGGDFRTNYETVVSLASVKTFSADVGLSNYGTWAAQIVEESFELSEDGIWRKSRKVVTPSSKPGSIFGNAIYPVTQYDMEKKKYVEYSVNFYRKHFVNETMANVTSAILNAETNDDVSASEIAVHLNDFGLVDGQQTLETRTLQA